MRSAESFWDKAAAKYAAKPMGNPQTYEETMARVRSYLGGDHHILEMGCGTGSTALLLADQVKHITACDISSAMIDIGRGKASDQRVENVDFRRATFEAGDLAEGVYDAVLAFNFLHLLEDLPGALDRASGLLQPGGLFISKTVCLSGGFSPWRFIVPPMQWLGLAPFVRFMTAAELEGMIAAAGFKILETADYPASPQSRFIVARKI